ncbi:MAG: MFS transporter [Candidatus Bathyarchaeota archaeon]|nr:MFS transporter [Candidatus Bathyarchaeota archaeon]
MNLRSLRYNLIEDIDRDVCLLISSMSLRRVVQSFLQIVRTIYLALIGFDPIAIGLITGVGSAVSMLESALFGSLSDRYGRKLFMVLGGLMSSIRLLLYAMSRDFWVLVIAQGIGALGEGEGAGQPVVSGYIADKIGDRVKRARIFSFIAITNALASTIGSLVAVAPAYFESIFKLNRADAHIPLFWIGVILSAVSLISAYFLKEYHRESRISMKHIVASRSTLKEIALYSLVRSTDGLAMSFVSSLAPLYFYLRFGVGSEDLAPVYAVARFLPIPLYLIAPMIVGKLGYVKPLIIVRAASGLSALPIALSWSFELSSLFFISYSALTEIGMPIRQTFATEIAGSSAVGSLVGISNSIRTMVRSIAPIITGYLFQLSAFSLPFAIGSSLSLLNSLQFHIFYSRRDPKMNPPISKI